MSLVASSISGAAYVLNNNEEKDTGNGFEFTRRKKWPQLLLQELTSSALFCIKPTPGGRGSVGSADGKGGQNMGWKILFVSPSVSEMLSTKPADIDGRDFLDYVFPADHPQLIAMFNSLITPHLTHQPSHSSSGSSSNLNMGSSSDALPATTSSHSLTTYVRMNIPSSSSPKGANAKNSGSSGSGSSSSNSTTGQGLAPSSSGSGSSTPKTVVWEIRAHATGVEGQSDTPAFGLGGGGTMVPTTTTQGDDMKGKAVWLMGRRVGEGVGDESNGQSLDAFLELKLENEKLREELRELQSDFDEDDYQTAAFPVDPQPQRPVYNPSPSSSPTPSSSSSSPPSSPAFAAQAQSQLPRPKAGPGRPPKDPATKEKDKEAAREKKRAKKNAASRAVGGTGAGNDGEGGMHVCVTCGRTDSPEWRKGPLGPKTLCNACGLRWAKRNSTAPTRKDKKVPGAPGGSK